MNDNDSNTALVSARGLRKEYGSGEGLVRAVDEVDLEVARGESVAIMGPSGCGKSTLLHLLGGLDRPTAGELWLADRRIDRLSERGLARLRRHDGGLRLPGLPSHGRTDGPGERRAPALLAGRSPRLARRRAQELLDRVGLADRADTSSALSGGQRQGVAIARALANDHSLVLADEPTGNLDGAGRLGGAPALRALRTTRAHAGRRHPRRRIAATADRLIAMRDGAFVDETRLVGSSGGPLGARFGVELEV